MSVEPLPNARPYDLLREHIEELYAEAKNFADGEPIATPGQAEAVAHIPRNWRFPGKRPVTSRCCQAKMMVK